MTAGLLTFPWKGQSIDQRSVKVKNYEKFKEYVLDQYSLAFYNMSVKEYSVVNNNGYKLLESLGHKTTNISPSLCALKTKENTKHLSGIRVKCKASITVDGNLKHQTNGEVLFKDDGLSGIAIFILSKYYEKNKNCVIIYSYNHNRIKTNE